MHKTAVGPLLNKTVSNFVALEVSRRKNIIIDQLDEVYIVANEVYLEKMFSLLIENALKYGKDNCDIIIVISMYIPFGIYCYSGYYFIIFST